MNQMGKGLLGKVLLLIVALVAAIGLGRWFNRPSGEPSVEKEDTSAATAPQVPTQSSADRSSHTAIIPLYMTYCAKCHGANGEGDAESIKLLHPPPRDFSKPNWRFSRTHAQISRIIQEGIKGTAMPPMKHLLSNSDTSQLADYVLYLSEARLVSKQPAPLPNDLVAFQDLGFTVYQTPTPAAALRLTSHQETSFQMSDAKNRITLIHFWSTTSNDCLKEMPKLAQLQNKYRKDGLLVLSICTDDDDLDTLAEIAEQIVPDHLVYADDSGLVTHKYSVGSSPTFVIIDGQHNLIARHSGIIDWSSPEVRQTVEQLLRQRVKLAQ